MGVVVVGLAELVEETVEVAVYLVVVSSSLMAEIHSSTGDEVTTLY